MTESGTADFAITNGLMNGQLMNGQLRSAGNGFVQNQPQPTPTPVPVLDNTADLSALNGEARRKQITWTQPVTRHDQGDLIKNGALVGKPV